MAKHIADSASIFEVEPYPGSISPVTFTTNSELLILE